VEHFEEAAEPAELRSWIRWRAIERGDDHPKPHVLYFRQSVPEGLSESGLYLCYQDFKDVAVDLRRQGTTPESNFATTLFRDLVIFFSGSDPRLLPQAYGHLRPITRGGITYYSPYWDPAAPDHCYYLLAQSLIPFAAAKISPDLKIPGVGTKGRRVMRMVLFDDIDIETALAEERARFDNND
jgi:hypothetical protein